MRNPRTAFSVGHAEFESPPIVSSDENSAIDSPTCPPIAPSFNSVKPDKLNADASKVAAPVNWLTEKYSPTLKLPPWSVDTKKILPGATTLVSLP